MGEKSNPKERLAQTLYVATADIRAAESACRLFLDRVKSKDDDLYNPLLTAIIVCYARPFTNNRGYDVLEDKWHKFEKPELEEIHKTILAMRNQVIAHSDAVGRRVHFKREETPPFGQKVTAVTVVSDCLAIESFKTILEACQDLGNRLEESANNELDSLN